MHDDPFGEDVNFPARRKKAKPVSERPKRVDLNRKAMADLPKQGYAVVRVDHFNTYGCRTNDLMGFADILAMRPGDPPVMVQVTSWDNASSHRRKIRQAPLAATWKSTGGQILLLLYRARVSAGGAKTYDRIEEWL